MWDITPFCHNISVKVQQIVVSYIATQLMDKLCLNNIRRIQYLPRGVYR